MEKEIWKDIDGYGGQYQVSNLGRVRSFRIKSEGVLLKLSANTCGYYTVKIGGRNVAVHRLVAIAFVDGYHDGLQVNHKNEDKTDNRACNLEWITFKENVNYGTRTKRAVKGISKSLSVAVCQYDMNGNLIAKYPSMTIAAKETGVSSKLISRVCCGRRYHAGGYGWSYQHDYRRKYVEKKRYNIPHIEYDTASLEGEQWKDIAGYNGMYLVSNLGRVKSIDHNNVTFRAGKIMTLQKVHRHGKLYTIKVTLHCGAKTNKPRVCRLVADAFLSGYKKGFVLNHINGNVSDNRAENLEWVPYSQMNQSGRFRENTAAIAKRKAIIQMTLDGKFVAEYESLAAASKAVGAAHDNIRCVCIGKSLSCKGYKWKFKNEKQ